MTAEISDLVAAAVAVLPVERRAADLETLLCGYVGHLLDRNREVNLVSRKDTHLHVERFTRECLFLASVLQAERQGWKNPARVPRILDIGAGGGFPGIVLKIAIPDLDIHLVEATRKKATFLADVAAGLDLRATRIIWGRSEELLGLEKAAGKKELAKSFDWVTGKGLGTLEESARFAAPYLVPDGVHWTFKGKACDDELRSAGGYFRQSGFALLRREPIPGAESSWVVGLKLRRKK